MDSNRRSSIADSTQYQVSDDISELMRHRAEPLLVSTKEETRPGETNFFGERKSHRKSLKEETPIKRDHGTVAERSQRESTTSSRKVSITGQSNGLHKAQTIRATILNGAQNDGEEAKPQNYFFPYSINERASNEVCFKETLVISPKDCDDPGKYFVSIEKEDDGPEVVYQIYVSIRQTLGGIKQESTIIGRVTPMFTTLEEMRVDLLQIGNKKIEHNVYIINEGDNYHVSVSSFDGDHWEKKEEDFPVEKKTIMMGDGANYLFLRHSAVEGKKKAMNFTTILNDGSLHSCRYDFRHSIGRFGRNKEEIRTITAKKTINSPGGIQVFNWILSVGAGYILEEKRDFPPGSLQYPSVECSIEARTSDAEDESSATPEESEALIAERESVPSGEIGEEAPGELGEASDASRPEFFLTEESEEVAKPKESSPEKEPGEDGEGPQTRKASADEEGEDRKTVEGEVDGEEGEEMLIPQKDEDEGSQEKFSTADGEYVATGVLEGEGKTEDQEDEELVFELEEKEAKEEQEDEDKGMIEKEEETAKSRDSAKHSDEETASEAVVSEDFEALSTVLEESDDRTTAEGEGAEEEKSELEEEDEGEEGVDVEDDDQGGTEDEGEATEVAGEVSSGEDKVEDASEEEDGASQGEMSEAEEEGSEEGEERSTEEEVSGESDSSAPAKEEEIHRVFSFELEGYFPLDLSSEESEGAKLEEILRDIKAVKRDCKELRADIRKEQVQEEEWRRSLRGPMLKVGPLSWRLLESGRRMRIPRQALVSADGKVDQSLIPLQYRWREDPQLLSAYNSCKIRRRMDIRSYAADHEEITDVISDFLLIVLINKPEDVIKFTKEYFMDFK